MDLTKIGGNEWRNLVTLPPAQSDALIASNTSNIKASFKFRQDAEAIRNSDSIEKIWATKRKSQQRQFVVDNTPIT